MRASGLGVKAPIAVAAPASADVSAGWAVDAMPRRPYLAELLPRDGDEGVIASPRRPPPRRLTWTPRAVHQASFSPHKRASPRDLSIPWPSSSPPRADVGTRIPIDAVLGTHISQSAGAQSPRPLTVRAIP